MPTTLYLNANNTQAEKGVIAHRGRQDPVAGTRPVSTHGWQQGGLTTGRGSAVQTFPTQTVTGATSGVEVWNDSLNGPAHEFISAPLSAAATIAGQIVANLWFLESSMNANVAPQIIVERLDNTGAIVSTVCNFELGTEANTTTAAMVLTVPAASVTDTNFARGDRIRLRVLGNDSSGATMASGFTFTLKIGSTTGSADGDSYITFAETLTFDTTDPAGSSLYFTNTASDLGTTGAYELKLGSKGSGTTSFTRATTTGFTDPLTVRDGSSNDATWYSPQLAAFTLSGLIRWVCWMSADAIAAGVGVNVEIAVVNSDGSGAVVYGSGGIWGTSLTDALEGTVDAISTSVLRRVGYVAGPSTSVSSGQRIRVRVRIDDGSSAQSSGRTISFSFNDSGTSADSGIVLGQTVTTSGPTSWTGSASVSLTDTVTTTGEITAETSSSVAATVAVTTNAVVQQTHLGQATVALTNQRTTNAVRRTTTSSSVALVDAVTTTGRPTLKTTSSTAETAGVTTNAVRRTNAATTVALTDAVTTTARLTAESSSTTTEAVGITTSGTVSGGVVDHIGATITQLTNTVTTTAVRRTTSTTTVAITNSRVTTGRLTAESSTTTQLTNQRTTQATRRTTSTTTTSLTNTRTTTSRLTAKATVARPQTVTVTTNGVKATGALGATTTQLTNHRTTIGRLTAETTTTTAETVLVYTNATTETAQQYVYTVV